MADDEDLLSEESGDNTMLREAIDALRVGNKARARDLLTRLLKTDQKNPTYWVWLSAAVDTQKERAYCLQMVLQADPQNAAARRGLILLGVIPPDESVPPFPVNRARLWEEKLTIPREQKEKKRGWSNPMVRVFIILGIAVVVVGGLFIGGSLKFPNSPAHLRTSTRRPTVTLTFTPTVTPVFRTSTPTFLGPTPLWMFLDSTYTSTPIYVMTEHPVASRSAFEAGLRFLGAKDYPNAHALFQQAIAMEPEAPDLYYYIGETYRSQRNYRSARDAYQDAINLDPSFAPAFLGRARANLGLNPREKVINDLNQAISLDSHFAEAYIVRGEYLVESNPSDAKTDLKTALELTPDSALAYLFLADVQLNLGENDAALESATHANELDMTLVPVYLTLARAYIATGQTARAVSVLQTYTQFYPDDPNVSVQLGAAYNAAGDYEKAVAILFKAITADRKNAEAYFQRGTAYLNLDNAILAEADFRLAVVYDPFDFDSHLGLARAYFMELDPRRAYAHAEQYAIPLAQSDVTKAQVYYWEALFLEEIGDPISDEAALNNWTRLIALPEDVMPESWRLQAYLHLNITPTFTPTFTPTLGPTETPTQTQIQTP
jgi:tetratricopeptide (TPR) repeat protein